MCRVGDDKPVEAQLFTQKALQKFRCHRGGHNLLVPYAGPQLAGIGRLLDMPHHDAGYTRADHSLVHLPVGGIPFLAGTVIYRSDDMLVPVITAVTGKMLHAAGDARLVCPFHVSEGHLQHSVWIAAETARRNNTVAPVPVNIHNWGKRPVAAHRRRLAATVQSHLISAAGISCGRACNAFPDFCAACHCTVTARLHIGCDEQRDSAVFLCRRVLSVQFPGLAVIVAQAAGWISSKQCGGLLPGVVPQHIHKQLGDFSSCVMALNVSFTQRTALSSKSNGLARISKLISCPPVRRHPH